MSEKKKSFVVFRENEVIYTLKFSPLNRESVDAWRDHLLKYDGQFPDPLRVLYDYTDCDDVPSPYILGVIRDLIPKLSIPKNNRNAYLVPNENFNTWVNVFFATRAGRGQGLSFYDREKAIAWLMEGLATPEDSPNENKAEE